MSSTVVHVRLPRDVFARLDEQAHVEMRSRAGMARVLLSRILTGPPELSGDDVYVGDPGERHGW